MTNIERLLRFARASLQILQDNRDADAPDTVDALIGLAIDLNLGSTDEESFFVSGTNIGAGIIDAGYAIGPEAVTLLRYIVSKTEAGFALTGNHHAIAEAKKIITKSKLP